MPNERIAKFVPTLSVLDLNSAKINLVLHLNDIVLMIKLIDCTPAHIDLWPCTFLQTAPIYMCNGILNSRSLCFHSRG